MPKDLADVPIPTPISFNLDVIDDHFPKEEYREGQKEAVEFALNAFNNGKKIVILECPTGSGKSAIGMTIANMVKKAYYLTVTKVLQDQLTGDFGDEIVELKGRNAYPCTFYNRFGQSFVDKKLWTQSQLDEFKAKDPDCASGFCRTKWNRKSPSEKKYKCDKCFLKTGVAHSGKPKGELNNLPPGKEYSACPYYEQVHKAIRASKVVMNFFSFLFQTQMTKRFDEPRDLMIIDECLHPHTRIQTEAGLIPIGKIVNQHMDVLVASFNFQTQQVEYKQIKRWLKRDKKLTYKVLVGNRVLYPTLDHKIFTPNGKKRLSELSVGDKAYVRQTEITDDQEQLVLGSLLGDACLDIVESKRISKRYVNKGIRSRVRFRHGPKQYNYLMWKYKIMQPHAKTKPELKPSAGFTKSTASFGTTCNFWDITKYTVINGIKTPHIEWLSRINEFGLAVWFMDDGSTSSDSARFHTEGFTLAENEVIVKWLHGSWNIDAEVKETHKKGKVLYYIQLGRESTRLLMSLISKYIPHSMRYKLQKCVPHDITTGWALRNPKRFDELALLPQINEKTKWDAYDQSIETQICKEVSAHEILLIEPYKETFNFDLEVEDNHNYFAGNALVSNCHNVEPQLLNFVSFSITDQHLSSHGIFIPELDHALEYKVWLEDSKVHEVLFDRIMQARADEDTRLEDELSRTLKKYQMFMEHMENNDAEWVCEYEEKTGKGRGAHRRLTLKPVFAQQFAQQLLFKFSNCVLMMSATVLDVNVMCRSLGIDRKDVAAYRVKNRFPKENRPIHLQTVAKMTGGKSRMGEWGPPLVEAVNRIVKDHKGQKGIIHTHNFAIMDYLIRRCDPDAKRRFLDQRKFGGNKKAMLAKHGTTRDTILIAPAMHEGIDLIDDLSRFQIICKVPYANCFDDEQLARRVEVDRSYYTWLTALKLIQSYGRSVRSNTDYAKTYILDESIYKFMKDADKMLPVWFKEAIIDES
jgi:Rad3-related DNA helicase